MDKKRITIITPFYNTNIEYFKDFLCCLNNQTSKSFECLIINDGSDKKYLDQLSFLTKGNKNIKIIDVCHLGVSKSRNIAINSTKTDYLAFADSDDLISKTFVEEGLQYIEKYSPDLICGVMEYYPQKKGTKQSDDIIRCYKTKKELFDIKRKLLSLNLSKNEFRVLGTPCAKIIKSSIAKTVLFNEDLKIYEDQIFIRQVLDLCKEVIVVPEVWYHYRQDENSSIHKSFRESYYESLEPYLKTSYKLDRNENDYIKNYMRLNYIKVLYGSINIDFLEKGIFSNKVIKNHICGIIKNKIINDAIYNLNWKKYRISIIDVVNIMFLRKKMLHPIIVEKKILFFLKSLKNELSNFVYTLKCK